MDLRTDTGEVVKNHGWQVALAGMGINLALGVLYSWSVISGAIEKAGWGWSQFERSLPYSVACLVFCLVMVPAGRLQDRFGPRIVATFGGLLVGAGMVLASVTTSPAGYVIGFGFLTGAGIGFGYASATPPAVKWFPPQKTGMVAGIVVSGFGLASVYAAPLAKWLSDQYGLQGMMMTLGVAFLVVVVALAQLLRAPHRALQFMQGLGPVGEAQEAKKKVPAPKRDFSPMQMLKTPQFYLMWFMYACGAGAGLMVISVAQKIGKARVGLLAVVALGIGNGAGRILAGMISDKIGRKATVFIFLILQAMVVGLLSLYARGTVVFGGELAIVVISALVGANYGSNLSLFPSITKDFYGLKHFGMNYGLVFTSWGVGGFVMAQMAATVYDRTQSFKFAFYGSVALLVLAAIMTVFLREPKAAPAEAEAGAKC